LLEQSHKNNEELKSQLNQLQLEAKVLGFTWSFFQQRDSFMSWQELRLANEELKKESESLGTQSSLKEEELKKALHIVKEDLSLSQVRCPF
jgi:hypothetical protein